MGKGSAAIAANVERRRDALRSRITRLETRVRDDLDETQATVKDRVLGFRDASVGRAKDAGDTVATKVPEPVRHLVGADSPAREHPGRTLALAGAAGFVAARLIGGDDRGHQYAWRSDDRRYLGYGYREGSESLDEGPRRAKQLASKGASSLTAYLRAELATIARDTLHGIWSGDAAKPPEPGTWRTDDEPSVDQAASDARMRPLRSARARVRGLVGESWSPAR